MHTRFVVSTAKVQKIWEQFTTIFTSITTNIKLFRLQKYKKFESNSQQIQLLILRTLRCFDCKSTKNLRAIHNNNLKLLNNGYVVSTAKVQKIWEQFTTESSGGTLDPGLFRLQKYKKFESNSQHYRIRILKSIVVSTAKVQKIWEQFTTSAVVSSPAATLFRLQKYKKFESNSQPWLATNSSALGCFDCKSTKNLRAIHNSGNYIGPRLFVVSTAKVQKIWEQFTTQLYALLQRYRLFRLQKYKKFESNSQRLWLTYYAFRMNAKTFKDARSAVEA